MTAFTHGRNMKIVRIARRFMWVILIMSVLIVAARLVLPKFVLRYVNTQLQQIPDYKGEVSDISIHLYRGAYRIHNLRLKKISGKVPVPFFESPLIDLSVQWRELLHGALVGSVKLDSPKLNFVHGEKEADSQVGIEPTWQDVAKRLFPLRINHFTVKDGQIHFRNFHTEPQVDIFIDKIEMSASNLTNSRSISKTMVAQIEATGRGQSEADLKVRAELDPFSNRPTFSLSGSLEHLNITRLNSFFEGYLAVDVKSGEFSLFTEMQASKGAFSGYLKPVILNLEVLSLSEDVKNPFTLAWKALVAAVMQLFTNPSHDQLATKVELSGNFDKPDVGYFNAIGWLLYNAFIRALSPSFETPAERKQPEDNQTR